MQVNFTAFRAFRVISVKLQACGFSVPFGRPKGTRALFFTGKKEHYSNTIKAGVF
jgi:hypothetical protein